MSRFEGKICPVCLVRLKDGDDVVVCPICGTPHHRECYFKNSKCAFEQYHEEYLRSGTMPNEASIADAANPSGQIAEKTADDAESKTANENNNNEESADEVEQLGNLFKMRNDVLDIRSASLDGSKAAAPQFSSELDRETDEDIEKMLGMPSELWTQPAAQEYIRQMKEKLANTNRGEDGVSMRELVYVTASSIWHYTKAYVSFFAKKTKRSFNPASGLFFPMFQFYRKMDGWGILLTLFVLFTEGLPLGLLRYGAINESAANVMLLVGSVLSVGAMVLLCVFNDYLYFRQCIKRIHRVRRQFDGKTDTIEYYHALYESGKPSVLRGLFGCLLLIVVRVFISVVLGGSQ